MQRWERIPSMAPPVGPYSPAVSVGGWLFISGQIALDEKGQMQQNSLEEETHQVMRNLFEVLGTAGAKAENIVKTTIFLTDMKDFATVNEIYGSYFSGGYPARETVAVQALPRGARVEISAIAYLG
ncbi:MAG: Rid family detoxifying hydrolase [Bacteroidia bacterium]